MMMETSNIAPLAGFGVVPDVVGDFDFDLGTIDTFNDMDIDMESFNLIDDQDMTDPFGNLSFEQSLSIVDTNKDSDTPSILDDFDVKEPIRQDCMWSAFQDAGCTRIRSLHIKHKKSSRSITDTSSHTRLTPPSSYINDHLRSFDTPLPSDDESSDELDLVNPASMTCSRVMSHEGGDHCYTSTSIPVPWGDKTSAAAPLTPPESSEDEDSSQGLYAPGSPPGGQGRKKTGLSEVENDRFNKKVNCVLKKSSKAQTSTNSGKAKFRFSFGTRNKSSLLTPKCQRLKKQRFVRSQSGSYQLLSIKENKQLQRSSSTSPSPSPTYKYTKQKSQERFHREQLKQQGASKLDHKDARDVHNQMERQRRTDLKNAFDSLKDFVPTIANADRASKQMVLDKAMDYCKALKSKEFNIREQRKNLVQKNESLRKRLALLESKRTSCELENAAWEIQGW